MTEEQLRRMHRLSSFQIITGGFACVILVGALLLMLPISSASGLWTPFHETLFTATSAVCVTGLVVQDTGTYWSSFGQAIILMLIQIGGLGIITVAAAFALLSGRKISLMQRSTMQDAISAPKVGGIVRLTRFILCGTFLIELLGALALLPAFCRDYGLRGIWYAIFHSISAFCNAGFDLLGRPGNLYPSLTAYTADPVVNITIMLLIVIGGIGFLTWEDICTNRLHFHRYRMQSKVILVTTLALIVLPAALFFAHDYSGLPLGERLLAATEAQDQQKLTFLRRCYPGLFPEDHILFTRSDVKADAVREALEKNHQGLATPHLFIDDSAGVLDKLQIAGIRAVHVSSLLLLATLRENA